MDAAGRLKGRPGVRQQDVAERRAKPTAPVAEYAPFKEHNLQYAKKIGMAVKVGFEAFQPLKEKAAWMTCTAVWRCYKSFLSANGR